MKKDSGTRSGLLWEVERLLNECENELPQCLLMENVPQVIGEKNKADFDQWCLFLESKGYSNYYELLNAKDYGIPQNRNRCFMISILGDYYYEFPNKKPLKLKLKDMLEENVDEKYYLSDKMMNYLTGVNQKKSNFSRGERFFESLKQTNEKGIATTISTNAGNRPVDNFVTEPNLSIKNATEQGYLPAYEDDGIDISSRMESHRGTVQPGMAQTLKTQADVGVVVKANTPNLKAEYCNKLIEKGLVKENDVIRHSYTNDRMNGDLSRVESKDNNICPTLETRCDCLGVVVKIGNYSPSNHNASSVVDSNGIAPTVMENHGTITAITEPKVIGGIGEKKSNNGTQWYQQDRVYDGDVSISVTTDCNPYYLHDLRIRKLTPKECFRLMGLNDSQYNLIKQHQSNASLYHLAGDSIVVNVLMAIFERMM